MTESVGRWPDLQALPGVADAVRQARDAISAARRLPANRRGWPRTAAAAAIRAARASAMLDGGSATVTAPEAVRGAEDLTQGGAPSTVVSDPVLAGALRVSAAVGELSGVWPRAPLQALAKLHTLAAADLVDPGRLGRPRTDAGVGDRLALLADVVTGAPWTAPILVAVVHGELLTVRPFGSADGVVARAAARLTMVATGLDPQALTVPEVGYLRAGERYRSAAAGFADGTPDGVANWIAEVCSALRAGAREARSIAIAAAGGTTPELEHSRHHEGLGG